MPLTPPDAIFVSMNALLDSAKAHASNHGFVVTILCSKKNKEGYIYKIWALGIATHPNGAATQ